MSPASLPLIAVCLLVVYAVAAAIDGIWLHLLRYHLHARPDTVGEHALHTARAWLFPLVIVGLVEPTANGWWLIIGVSAALIDLVLVAVDAAVEHHSRRFQHGLPAGEAALHIFLHTVHVALLILVVLMHSAAWAPPSMAISPIMRMLGAGVVVGGIAVAILHTVLGWRAFVTNWQLILRRF